MGNSDCLNVVTRQINSLFGNKEPWQVASITAMSLMTALWIWEQIKQDESKYSRFNFDFISFFIDSFFLTSLFKILSTFRFVVTCKKEILQNDSIVTAGSSTYRKRNG